MHSLFRTLRQLHESGLVVQDIKPPNILIDHYNEPVRQRRNGKQARVACVHRGWS